MESSMLGVQAALKTPAPASAAVVGACPHEGMAAVLLPGSGATARLRAATDASKPRPRGIPVLFGRQDTPQQHNLRKFAYSKGTAAANGEATGLHQACWDPV